MALHLIKLCVGAESVADMEEWVATQCAALHAAGKAPVLTHVTRQMPKRADDIVGQGSLYWIIKGHIALRQPIVDLTPVEGDDGITRCAIRLSGQLIRTQNWPRRPFQGWRYLEAAKAPPDLDTTAMNADLAPLHAALQALKLL